MDMDWELTFEVLGAAQIICMTMLFSLFISQEFFWKELKETKEQKKSLFLFWFSHAFWFLPILTQIFLYLYLPEIINKNKERLHEEDLKSKMKVGDLIPKSLRELCVIVIKKGDYIIERGNLVNKEIPLTIGTHSVNIKGRLYDTKQFEDVVLDILHKTEYADTLKIYIDNRGA